MAGVTRLLILVDIDDADDDGPTARRMSVTARHEAVLEDGRRVVLFDDRGWSGQLGVVWAGDAPPPEAEGQGLATIWAFETVEGLERTARAVVGPDEPAPDGTPDEMEASHWKALAGVLREQGVEVETDELRQRPHDVELSSRLRARVARAAGRPS
jgi:hypothetical protein